MFMLFYWRNFATLWYSESRILKCPKNIVGPLYIYIYIYMYIFIYMHIQRMILFGLVNFDLVLLHINHYRLFNDKSVLYIHIQHIWFGLVWFWHINHCRLSNAKYSLYICIKYTWFCLVGLYCISTSVGYFMPNPLYTCTLVGWVLWHCRLFNAKSVFINNKFYFKQFSPAWVHSLIVENISISSNPV